MEDSEFFLKIDAMLSETLSTRQIKVICDNFKENINKHVDEPLASLKFKEKGEEIVRMFLEMNQHIFLSKCKDVSSEYKFIKNGKELSYEINTDIGNKSEAGDVEIEFERDEKSSGIDATKAEYWISYFPHLNQIWLIKVKKLKELIETNKETIGIYEKSGESNTKAYILNREEFGSYFKIVNVC